MKSVVTTSAQRNDVFVAPRVAHNPHGFDGQVDCKGLAD